MSIKREGEALGQGPNKAAKKGGMTFAQRMMAKMGHEKGRGLGATGEGIAEPIEVRLRSKGAGIGAAGGEKTEQAKREARRTAEMRGEEYEASSEEEQRKARKRRSAAAKGSGPGTPTAAAKPKTKFRTVSEIQAGGLEVPKVLQSIIDMSGKEAKLLTSTPTLGGIGFAPQQTEEEKIAKRAQQELEQFARAWDDVQEHNKGIVAEESQAAQELGHQHVELEDIQGLISAVDSLSTATASWEEIVHELEEIQIRHQYMDRDLLAEIAVAAVHPLFRREMAEWDPLEEPDRTIPYLQRLKAALNTDGQAVQHYGDDLNMMDAMRTRKSTTAYESMILLLWLPKMRSTVTHWQSSAPWTLISAVEAWRPFLPDFVYGALIESITQKLRLEVEGRSSRSTKKTTPLSDTIFPWLPYLQQHDTDPSSSHGLLSTIKNHLKRQLQGLEIGKGAPSDLVAWKEALGASAYREMLVRYLLPRLSRELSALEIYPPEQDLEPLERALAWQTQFRPTDYGQLLLAEFFPKLLNTLYTWLTSEPNFEEIGQWYTWWRSQVPEVINAVPAVQSQWDQALEMINNALDLGEDVATGLQAPAAGPAKPIAAPMTPQPSAIKDSSSAAKVRAEQETTFRDIVEEWCASENLLFMPLREAHSSGAPKYRITASATGRGGVIVYIKGDIVWAQNKKDKTLWEPVGLEEKLIEKAEGK